RRPLRGDEGRHLPVGAGATVGAEGHLVVRVDLPVVEREQDVGAGGQLLVVERGQQPAEGVVVVVDDLRELRAVGAVGAGRIVVQRHEVPDEHGGGQAVVADVVGG